ncbi:hypothetical protein TSAR_016954 [Trichomalopsis sarcophagae]|uniref:Ionotropic glutamate receptor C-terminal domain-containing protein n=1 Tax=Trichomalopsis sarcophagae TaxID=543379 RepID=A0A232ETL7_9HYME|nr:hypothetical protein TSAR_016954 [Trichomalopsis sarcophagae]
MRVRSYSSMSKHLVLFLLLKIASAHKAIVCRNLETEAFCRSTISIADALKPFQIVLILDNVFHQNTIEARFTRKCIFEGYPIITLDFHGLEKLKPVMDFTTFGTPRSSTLFVTLSSNHPRVGDTFSELSRVLESYSKIWSKPIRPLWLNIFFNQNDEAPPSLQDFLRYSWKLKFLDLTILESRNFSQMIVHHYNPFTDCYTWEAYNDTLSTEMNLFPDKLHDMHGYRLRTIFLHEPPTLYLKTNSTGHLIDLSGTDYWNVQIVAKIINFTLVSMPTYADDYVNDLKRQSFAKMEQDIHSGVIDFSGNQFYQSQSKNESVERSYSFRPESQCAFLPLQMTRKLNMPYTPQLIMFTGLYILILRLASKGMRFNRQLWTWVYLIKLIVGVPVFFHPRALAERVLMGCLIMISLFYLSDFYSKITDMQLTFTIIPIEGFKDLDQSQLIPLVYPMFLNWTFKTYDEDRKIMQSLKSKAEPWNNPESCADHMISKNESVFCILPETLGKIMVEKFHSNSHPYSRRRIQMMEPCFLIAWKSYVFTPGSPYVDKFDKVLINVIESGLMAAWKQWSKPRKMPFENHFSNKQKATNSRRLKRQMTLVISIGTMASVSVFIAEIIVCRMKIKCLYPFERLINDIIDEMNPYQILLLVNATNHRSIRQTMYVQKFLAQDFPTTTIDFQHMSSLSDIMDYPTFGSPRGSTLFVLLHTSILDNEILDLAELNYVLDDYVEAQSRAMRPRWLTVLVNSECGSNPNIELFLREAWKKKFLDFTVLEMLYDEQDVVLHYYNPFKDAYEVCAYSENVSLFPDKLHDINGYPLTTIFLHEPPRAYVTRNSSGHIISVNGSDYWVIKTTSEVLNFTVITEPTFANDYSGFYNRTHVIEAIQNGELDLVGNQIYMWVNQYLERSMVLAPDAFCALVPNIFTSRGGLSQNFYYGMGFSTLYIASLVWITRLLRFDRNIWTWDNLLQIILGCSNTRRPRGFSERLVLASIMIVSVTYTTVYYARITDKNLKTMAPIPFNSYRDLDRSSLIPLVYGPFFNYTFADYRKNKYIRNLKNRAQIWHDLNICIEEMMRNRSVVCILPEALGLSMVDLYREHDGKTKLRVMNPCFYVTLRGFAYTPGSPYVDKFDKLFVRIKEAGLQDWWDALAKPRVTGYDKEDTSERDAVRERIHITMIFGSFKNENFSNGRKFMNEAGDVRSINRISSDIIRRKATKIVDTSFLDINKYCHSNKRLRYNPRYTTYFIALIMGDSVDSHLSDSVFHYFDSTLHFIIKLSPSTTRPYYLVVIDTDKIFPRQVIEKMLLYAWSVKFLDITILQFSSEDSAGCSGNFVQHTYNPFTKSYSTNCFASSWSSLFPDKLRDMHKHPLKISLIRRAPWMDFDRDSSGHAVNFSGSDYRLLHIYAQSMNFSIEPVALDVVGYAEPLYPNSSLNLLYSIFNGDIDFSGNNVYLHMSSVDYEHHQGEQSNSAWIDDYVVLVPSHPTPQWNFDFDVVYLLLSVLGQVVVLYLLAKRCKFDPRQWQAHVILQFLLGNPAPRTPGRSIERVCFICLFILSQHFSASIYARLARMSLNRLDLGPFHTLDDLVNSDLVVEAHKFNADITFNHYESSDDLLYKLSFKVKRVNAVVYCPEKILTGKVACLIDKSIAQAAVRKYSRHKGPPRMKILNHVFWSAPKGTIFSSASPYVPRYNWIQMIVHESGLWSMHSPRGRRTSGKKVVVEYLTDDMSGHFLRGKLIALYCSGCAIAVIAFLSESIVYYVEKNC